MNTLTVRPAAELDELDELVTAVRAAVARNTDWRDTASHVADALREHLPPPDRFPRISLPVSAVPTAVTACMWSRTARSRWWPSSGSPAR